MGRFVLVCLGRQVRRSHSSPAGLPNPSKMNKISIEMDILKVGLDHMNIIYNYGHDVSQLRKIR